MHVFYVSVEVFVWWGSGRERERLKPDEVLISVYETDISKNLIITMKIKAP